jgi:hypothetical protein
VINIQFINTEKVYLSPQDIKLGLIKKLQGNDQISAAFIYMKNKSPRRSDAKIKEGVFVGPQIRRLTQDVKSEDQLDEVVPGQVQSQYPCLLLDIQRMRSTGKI